MANPSRSLNGRVHWHQVLHALGASDLRSSVLPQLIPCPLSHKHQMQIFDDRLVGGQWAHCRSCHFGGDMIELAAAAWHVQIDEALLRLGDLGILADPLTGEELDDYLRDHIRYRRRLNQFWEQARRRPMHQTSLSTRYLLRQLSMSDQAMSPQWLECAGRWIGSASCREVDELFAPDAYAPQMRRNHNGNSTRRRGGGPGARRLFHGPGWEDVLVVPFYDLPGRICGFQFAGRNMDPDAGDFLFKRANLGGTARRVREAGVGMLPVLDDVPCKFLGDDLFVLSDPLVALLLQGQQQRDSIRPLPVLLSHHSPQVQTLHLPPLLEGCRLIFWGRNDLHVLRQAKRWNALVSNYPISHKAVAVRLNHHAPQDWLRLIKKNAMPWRAALRLQMEHLDLTSAEAFLKGMEFTPEELRELSAGSTEMQQRLRQCDPDRCGGRRVRVGGKSIVESEEGWTIEGSGERICNRPIRIEEILQTDEGCCYYRGTVHGAQGLHQFTLDVAHVRRRGLLACVADHVLTQDAAPLNYQPSWNGRALFIATEFSAPRVVTGAERIGWHPQRRGFVFPEFTIRLGGEIERQVRPLILDAERTPARHLEPVRLSRRHVAALSALTGEVAIVWAMLACVTHNLLAPAMFRQGIGIILDGESAQNTGRTAARVLGCCEVDLRSRCRNRTLLERIHETCSRHDWPTIVHLPARAQVTADWADDAGPHNAILPFKKAAVRALAAQPGFVRICSPQPPGALGELRRAAARLMPEYLQDVCERKLWIDRTTDHHVLDIVADIAGWFERFGGDGTAVASAREVLFIDSAPSSGATVEHVARSAQGV